MSKHREIPFLIGRTTQGTQNASWIVDWNLSRRDLNNICTTLNNAMVSLRISTYDADCGDDEWRQRMLWRNGDNSSRSSRLWQAVIAVDPKIEVYRNGVRYYLEFATKTYANKVAELAAVLGEVPDDQ